MSTNLIEIIFDSHKKFCLTPRRRSKFCDGTIIFLLRLFQKLFQPRLLTYLCSKLSLKGGGGNFLKIGHFWWKWSIFGHFWGQNDGIGQKFGEWQHSFSCDCLRNHFSQVYWHTFDQILIRVIWLNRCFLWKWSNLGNFELVFSINPEINNFWESLEIFFLPY